jgi:hypothetical protein
MIFSDIVEKDITSRRQPVMYFTSLGIMDGVLMHPPRETNFSASSIYLCHLRLPVTVVTDVFGSECLSVPSALITGLQLSDLIMHGIFNLRQGNWQYF